MHSLHFWLIISKFHQFAVAGKFKSVHRAHIMTLRVLQIWNKATRKLNPFQKNPTNIFYYRLLLLYFTEHFNENRIHYFDSWWASGFFIFEQTWVENREIIRKPLLFWLEYHFSDSIERPGIKAAMWDRSHTSIFGENEIRFKFLISKFWKSDPESMIFNEWFFFLFSRSNWEKTGL